VIKTEQRMLSRVSGWRTCVNTLAGELPQLVLVFGPRPMIEDLALLTRVREAYPRSRLVVASGAGEFSGPDVSDDQLIVTAIAFEHSTVRAVVRTVGDRGASHRVGREIAHELFAPDLVHVFVLCDGLRVNGSRLAEGLSEVLPAHVSVTGGLAGDGTAFQQTLVGLDANVGPDRVVAVGFCGSHLRVGHGCSGGWVPYGEARVVTRCEDNMLLELDGQPALQLYREHLGAAAATLPGSALRFPLHVTPVDGGATVVRTSHSIDVETGVMEFAGDIPLGARVRFLRATPEDLIGGAVRAAQQARKSGVPELVLCVNCVARRLVLEEHAAAEMTRLHDIFSRDTPLAGFYSYGEIAPAEGATGCQFHNQTMTITALREV
jgi:hypothetical protein